MASFGFDESIYCNLGFNDEDVVRRARRGDERAAESIMLRYRPLVETKARAFFLVGADHDDVVQEGMIGLYKAIRDFRTDRRAKFRPFAELCVTRQIITAVKTATRQKHCPLNGYVSLNQSLSGDEGGMLIDVLPDNASENPEERLMQEEEPIGLHDAVKHLLSRLESRVLRCYLQGKSYREISKELRCHQKAIDNALQRVKKKLYGFLQD